MKIKKVLLFDIDGTLILSGGAGARALNKAFEHLHGVKNAQKYLRFDGMTDRAIFRFIVKKAGIPTKEDEETLEETIDQTIEKYLEFLPHEVNQAKEYRILPGIEKILEILRHRADILLGIASGNMKKGAQIKLGRANLFAHFLFGGFGCDSEIRSEIVSQAIQRAKDLCQQNISAENIYVIGDTHHDIQAGKSLGVKTIAVTTGSFSSQDLANYKPNFLFSDFSNVEKFLSLFPV